jgi:hypothetical protein
MKKQERHSGSDENVYIMIMVELPLVQTLNCALKIDFIACKLNFKKAVKNKGMEKKYNRDTNIKSVW